MTGTKRRQDPGCITDAALKGIIQTFQNIYFAYMDHQYLSMPGGLSITRMSFLSQNQIFFRRIQYYLLHFSIIEINKLLTDGEAYSLRKFIVYELAQPIIKAESELREIQSILDAPALADLNFKIIALRNKSVAHLTPVRDELKGMSIQVSEVELVINLTYAFLRVFNKFVHGVDYEIPITSENLGYELHKQHAKSLGI